MAAQADGKMKSFTNQKVRVEIESGRTRIFVDDTEIIYATMLNIHADCYGIPEIKLRMLAPDLQLITDGTAGLEILEPKKERTQENEDQRIHSQA